MIPPHERLDADCFQFESHYYLAFRARAGALAALGQGAFSPVCLRYAYPGFETRRPYFPFMAADDWGNLFHDLEAVDWLIGQGLMYPRADVAGVWVDGARDQLFVKELDLAVPPTVYAAASAELSDFPGHPLRAALEFVAEVDFAMAPGANLPARLSSALPVFQVHAGLPVPQSLALLTTVLRDPRLVRLDEVDGPPAAHSPT